MQPIAIFLLKILTLVIRRLIFHTMHKEITF